LPNLMAFWIPATAACAAANAVNGSIIISHGNKTYNALAKPTA